MELTAGNEGEDGKKKIGELLEVLRRDLLWVHCPAGA